MDVKKIVLILLLATAVFAELKSRKDAFYDSDSFEIALVGDVTDLGHKNEFYSFAKIDTYASENTNEVVERALYITILKERTLMSDRQNIIVFLKEVNEKNLLNRTEIPGFTEDTVAYKVKISEMADATVPINFNECYFAFIPSGKMQSNSQEMKFNLIGLKNCRDFSGEFKYQKVDYKPIYFVFIVLFLVCACTQLWGIREMVLKAKADFHRYMKKVSMFGFLMDSTLASCLMYHFGVFLPVDIKLVLPQVLIMINSAFFWMQKMVHNVNQNPHRRMMRLFQFLCTMIMMIGGLYVPSIDRKSYSLLGIVLLPLALQIWNSFSNRVTSFTIEYNIFYKIPQALIIAYIFGWPGTPVHLLPTYPIATMTYIVIFCLLTIVNYLQKAIHPRFYIKTFEDYKRAQMTPQRVGYESLAHAGDGENKNECSICLGEFQDSPDEHIMLTPCGHTFHEACLVDWLIKNENCPLCRKPVVHPDENYFDKS